MTIDEAQQYMDEHKFSVVEGEIDGKRYFMLSGDPIPSGNFKGKNYIITCLSEEKEDRLSRLQDMQEDCRNFYGGRDADSYKKIVWPKL